MATPAKERILIVENDPVIIDVIARQALQGAGYETLVLPDAGAAISRVLLTTPDMVIADLDLPGLNARDLMVALTAQNINTPVVALTREASEGSIIQAFRLGAVDYLLWPVREAEVIHVTERVLRQGRERRERERLARQLQQANQELQQRVRELTTIFSIGKAVTSITSQQLLFDKILEGAIDITKADLGWFLVKEEGGKNFLLAAQRGLPASLLEQQNQPWDDGISSLVAISGEPLTIHGDPLKRFKISALGSSAIITPVKAQNQVIALLVVMRKKLAAFNASDQILMDAAADYAAISLVNSSLFRAIENQLSLLQSNADTAKLDKRIGENLLNQARSEIQPALEIAKYALGNLVKSPAAVHFTRQQRHELALAHEQLLKIQRITEAAAFPPLPDSRASISRFNLTGLIREQADFFQQYAQQNKVTLTIKLPAEPLEVQGDAGQIMQVIRGLLSNAIKYCNPGGSVTVKAGETMDQMAQVQFSNSGDGIESQNRAQIFEEKRADGRQMTARFGGLGISLPLVKEIVSRQKGKIWIESKDQEGASFFFSIPLAK